jgi:HEAT repeat protein
MSQMLASPYTAFAVDLAVDVLLKGTLILGAAGVAAYFLRGTSAAARHAIWSLAFGALLALPVLQAVLPSWKLEPLYVSVRSQAESYQPGADFASGTYDAECDCSCDCDEGSAAAGSSYAVGGGSGTGRDATGAVPVGFEVPAGPGAAQGASGASGVALALLIWLMGAGLLLGRFAIDAFRVSGIVERAARASDADCSLAHSLAASLGIRRNVRLAVSDEVTVPVTSGVWLPVVILPAAAVSWSAERRRVVLLHELAHVRRWDYAVHVAVEIACALYWFNPLVWLAARFNNLEQERACDDQALHGGIRSDVYAMHLVEIARAVVGDTPRGAFAMARPSSLASRVKSILARGLDRAPLSQRQFVSVAVGLLSVAFPLASVDIWGVLQANDAVELRVQELQDGDGPERRYAAWALGELESSKAVDPLVDALNDRDSDVRLVSAWALGEIKENESVEPLTDLLNDKDPFVREMAVLALGEIGSTRAIKPIMNAVEQDESLREPAFWALDQIGGERAHDARHELFEHRGELGWESEEVWTGYLGTRAARSIGRDVSALIAALEDDDADMRCSAAEYLGDLGDPQAVEALLDTLRDPDPAVRAMAIWALDEINPSRGYET